MKTALIEPIEVLQHLADIISERQETRLRLLDAPGQAYSETVRAVDSTITLAEIKEELVDRMAAQGVVFSSEYRHERTPEHSIVYRMLGSTVEMNYRIWDRSGDSSDAGKVTASPASKPHAGRNRSGDLKGE